MNFNKDSSIETIETNLLMKILTDAIEKMSPEELKELASTTGMTSLATPTKEVVIGIFQAILEQEVLNLIN